ncbi:glycosyltransferase [bacterium]|nr:MAG: glycosyltransferase [bacterium]
MPRVTVALAVRNGEATLAKALDAVFAQTWTDFDVLVLDDGSTDATAEIASRYPLRLIRQENTGLGGGRKRLTEEATGEWIAFFDHDDFWTPDKMAVQAPYLDDPENVLIHADGWYIYEDGREVARDWQPGGSRSWDHILPSNRVIASTAVYRREAMLRAGNFVADTVRCSDWYGWFLIASQGRFVHVPQKVVRYSVLSTSLANAGYRFHAAQAYLLERHILPRWKELSPDLPEGESGRYRTMVRRNLGVALSAMARHGEGPERRKFALQALQTAPDVLRVWSRALSALR